MENINENIEQALKYLNNEMSESEKQDFEKDNLKDKDDFDNLMQLIRIENCLQPAQTTDQAWQNINKKIKPKKKSKILKLTISALSAAAAAAFIFFSIPNAETNKTIKYTAKNICENITLPDGSTICLNNGATVEYPQSFENERKIKFNGEGYFDIKHNAENKFTIETHGAQITVLGTEFNLNTNVENAVTVAVTDGCVRIENNAGTMAVAKNQQAIAENGKSPQKTEIADKILAWQANNLNFKNCKLEKVVEKLNYVYGQEVVFDDKEISQLKLTSRYTNANIDEIMQSISSAFNLKAEKSPITNVWVLSKK